MTDKERLQQLIQQYHEVRLAFIEAVEASSERNELDFLKRRLETIASQIRKIDVNHRFS
jgi:hypothetical protein